MTTAAKAEKLDCPECGSPMQLRESKHGLFYGCTAYPKCKGTHGAHPSGAPLGTPADQEIKQARIKAHDAFDKMWKGQAWNTRSGAYLWMQSKMGLSSDEAHIGKFTKAQCDELLHHLSEAGRAAREGGFLK